MSKLRKPHSSSFPSHSPYSDTSDKKQSALISTTNTFDDNWLEDDLGPKSKKQKFMQEPLVKTPRNSFSPVKMRSRYSPSPAKKKSSQEIDSTINDLSEWDVVADDFGFAFGDENDVPIWQSTAKATNRLSLSPRRTNPIKRQSSLLAAGFSRNNESPITIQADDIPDSTNEHLPVFSSPFKGGSVPERLTGLKTIVVKIADELISVPVKAIEIDSLDVGWLVNEVKRRYSK